MVIVQAAIFLGDNYPGSNNPRGNHPGGNCLWGNHSGCAIVRGWQFSGRAIIRGSITQGDMDGGGGQLSGEQFSSGEIFRIPFLPVEDF